MAHFQAGHCVVCGVEIDWGLLCSDHLVNEPVEKPKPIKTLAEMKNGTFGFIDPKNIFEAHDRYWIFLDAIVLDSPSGDINATVRKSKGGKYRIITETLDRSRLGWIGFDDSRKYTLAILEQVDSKAVMVKDLRDGQSGYTEPYAIFEKDSQLYIIATAGVIPEMTDTYKTMKILKKRGKFLIDRTTVDTNDILIGWPGLFDEDVECLEAELV